MKISHGWVSEFVQLDPTVWNAAKISSVLTDLGLEVEHIDDEAATLDRFVVGFVAECQKHPKADKLSVCRVDVGEAELRTIVCGAPNVAAGQFVAVALDGAIVPNGGFEISKRMLRGVESNGMICSFAELNMPGDSNGIWILAEMPNAERQMPNEQMPNAERQMPNPIVGMPLAEYLGKTDVIYDVAITPNRADCLSHIGIAREIQAYQIVHENSTAFPIQVPLEKAKERKSETENVIPRNEGQIGGSDEKRREATSNDDGLLIESVDQKLAPVYVLQKISNVKVVPSPDFIQQRLLSVGIKPRNIIVDVTNYVNMELGQPLHAFDLKKVRGSRFQVRNAIDGESLITLDGKERALKSDMLMICDMEGPIAVAGVMGGQNTEIDVNTTDVVLESAYFDPTSIRRTARNLGLNTDASYRFERGVDIGNVEGALQRAIELIARYAVATGSDSERPEVALGEKAKGRNSERATGKHEIVVRFDKMRAINGIDVSNEKMLVMFEALECEVVNSSDATCTLRIPTWRVDLLSEIDMAEEVMRLYGINNIPSAETAAIRMTRDTKRLEATGSDTKRHEATERNEGPIVAREKLSLRMTLRRLLAARGYSDCVTGSLTSPEFGTVKLKNALGLEYSALRSSVVPSLLSVASVNARNGMRSIRLCEIGKTYKGFMEESLHLTLVVCGDSERHWSSSERALDLYDLLGDIGVIGQITLRTRELENSRTREPLSNDETPLFTFHFSLFTSVNVVEIMAGSEVIGLAGQVDPSFAAGFGFEGAVYAAEISIDGIDKVQLLANTERVYKKIGVYPAVRRDLALIVDEGVSAGELVDSIRKSAPAICREVEVFDVYRDEKHVGAGRKSVAVALTFRDDERTLVDEEVESFVRTIIGAATKELGAHVRGGE